MKPKLDKNITREKFDAINACRTNWWYMLRAWNENEADDGFQLPLDMAIPDYCQLIKEIC